MKRRKILLIEDELKIQALIRDILIEDYDVIVVDTGEEGIELAREQQPDLIILDMLMPKMDGILACKFFRRSSSTRNIPIIILTALKEPQDRLHAFNAGADDFISKPFHPDELIARIESKIERFQMLQRNQRNPEILLGNLRMNLVTRQVFVNSNHIYLTVLEFDILKNLLEAEGGVRSRKQLIDSIWGDDSIPVRILDSHILSIRKKLKDFNQQIETIYGCGYVIREQAQERISCLSS